MNQALTFTSDQEQALAQFLEFIRARETRKLWVLTGYAGTGKSTLIAHLVQQMRAENHFKLSQAKHIRQLEADQLSKQCRLENDQLHELKQKKDRLRLKSNRNLKEYIRSQVQK
jgi:tRNA uridine 5-carbamoylmethylation protein Kti12